MKNKFRSKCLIASTLDIIGDKWSLLIIRDMFLEKTTFKEFSNTPERIAPGILSSRLKLLESLELITKRKLPKNKKENIYLLTEKGIDLAPLLTEIVLWSDKNVRTLNPEMVSIESVGFTDKKSKITEDAQMRYRAFVQNTID